MEVADSACISTSFDADILILTIDNSPNNTLPGRFFGELYACFQKADAAEVRAVVITGKGRSFSKGADLAELTGSSPMLEEDSVVQANRVFSRICRMKKPVVAAINGACFGGGLELALACHLRVCSEKSMLGLPEVSIGLIPGLGGSWRLAAAIGRAKALEMILLGDLVSAAKAQELNLVSRVFPKKNFMGHVLNFVRTLLAVPQEALLETLKLFQQMDLADEEPLIRASAAAFCRLARSKVERR